MPTFPVRQERTKPSAGADGEVARVGRVFGCAQARCVGRLVMPPVLVTVLGAAVIAVVRVLVDEYGRDRGK